MSTLLDYLVQLLHSRKEQGSTDVSAVSAFSIDLELAVLQRCKAISLTELTRDLNALHRGAESAANILQGLDSYERPPAAPHATDNLAMLHGGMSVIQVNELFR